MKYKNLILIGTSHIAKQSVNEVKKLVKEEKPEIIALELDAKRAYALTQKKKGRIGLYSIRRIGLKGFVFSIIGAWAERKLGEYVGMSPGAEMLQAIKLAKKEKIKIALIDQDIEVTLRKFSNALTWREKWNFVVDIFNAVVLRKKEIEFDLRTVPDEKVISKLIKKVKKRYPNVYKVLIEERNIVMAKNLSVILNKNPDKKIIAVVGAGHEEEIIRLMKRYEAGISYRFSIG